MKNVFIHGYAGNMGQRYRAILEYLGHDWTGWDANAAPRGLPPDADAFIIATPTDTHLDVLMNDCVQYGKPILCEKPVSKDLPALRAAMAECREDGVLLQLVSQYDELVDNSSEGPTTYDYFKTGADGLFWDTINIAWHARGRLVVNNKSPHWTCSINGKALSLAHMDAAYVEMVRRWLASPRDDIDRIIAAHEKVERMEVECRARS